VVSGGGGGVGGWGWGVGEERIRFCGCIGNMFFTPHPIRYKHAIAIFIYGEKEIFVPLWRSPKGQGVLITSTQYLSMGTLPTPHTLSPTPYPPHPILANHLAISCHRPDAGHKMAVPLTSDGTSPVANPDKQVLTDSKLMHPVHLQLESTGRV